MLAELLALGYAPYSVGTFRDNEGKPINAIMLTHYERVTKVYFFGNHGKCQVVDTDDSSDDAYLGEFGYNLRVSLTGLHNRTM